MVNNTIPVNMSTLYSCTKWPISTLAVMSSSSVGCFYFWTPCIFPVEVVGVNQTASLLLLINCMDRLLVQRSYCSELFYRTSLSLRSERSYNGQNVSRLRVKYKAARVWYEVFNDTVRTAEAIESFCIHTHVPPERLLAMQKHLFIH
jgi:hypothetical protein